MVSYTSVHTIILLGVILDAAGGSRHSGTILFLQFSFPPRTPGTPHLAKHDTRYATVTSQCEASPSISHSYGAIVMSRLCCCAVPPASFGERRLFLHITLLPLRLLQQ